MPRAARKVPKYMGDLLHDLGDIPPARVRLTPPPGGATETHLLAVEKREGVTCELVDGTLVEKPVGLLESSLSSRLSRLLDEYLDTNPIGFIAGEQGLYRLMKGLIRVPDVSFVRYSKLPGGRIPAKLTDLAPCLAVEILSPSNTSREMKRKLKEYFLAGTELVWIIDPDTREVRVHASPDTSTAIGPPGTLDGGAVLPGLALPVAAIFARLPA